MTRHSQIALVAGGLSMGLALLVGFASRVDGAYSEPFRPQFHFTPAKNWMNDPNGMVFYEGEYHLFYQYNPFGDKWGHMSWGHAVSTDLVHWQHLPLALAEENDVMIFSGSAVVDWKNTSGFGKDGKPPMVAIYTGHYTSKPLQNQHIAYSNDKGRTWTKYPGNPVLDIGMKDFRDPKVQWHQPTGRWVMTVALPVERKVRFYGSPNLKEWALLGEFGPAGVTAGIWECPDLFEMPVENQPGKSAWVLVANLGAYSAAGGSGGQYFVGQFDGNRFVADRDSTPAAEPEFVPPGKLIADFEGDTYGDWKATGEAFGPGPANGAFSNQNPVDGYKGRRLVNSYYRDDGTTGTLTSPEFEVTHPCLNFLIGGGAHRETRMDLWVDNKVVRTASGEDGERLVWRTWDVREFTGRKARVQIVDEHKGGWGHINVDQIMLADSPARGASIPGLWLDYGKDYYAAVSWSDIPKEDGRRLMIGWMSGWEYASDVPTTPWRSAMSVPRELRLRQTASGLRLFQDPVREMKRLRDKHHQFKGGTLADANAWLKREGIAGNTLEIVVELEPPRDGIAGLELFKSAREKTVLGVDAARNRFFVDRTQSGKTDFSPKFSGRQEAPLTLNQGRARLHLLLDACSVEVFSQDGEAVLTDLVFPGADSRGVEFFGPQDGGFVKSLDVWTLKTTWQSVAGMAGESYQKAK